MVYTSAEDVPRLGNDVLTEADLHRFLLESRYSEADYITIWSLTEKEWRWTIRPKIRELLRKFTTKRAPRAGEEDVERGDKKPRLVCKAGTQSYLMRWQLPARDESYVLFSDLYLELQETFEIFNPPMDGRKVKTPKEAIDATGHRFPDINQSYEIMKKAVTYEMQEMWKYDIMREGDTERAREWKHNSLRDKSILESPTKKRKLRKVNLASRKLVLEAEALEDGEETVKRKEILVIKLCNAEGAKKTWNKDRDIAAEDLDVEKLWTLARPEFKKEDGGQWTYDLGTRDLKFRTASSHWIQTIEALREATHEDGEGELKLVYKRKQAQ
ncbi:hypothetical protein LTR85_001983 [Meristemomyces frigidus]|nr:hypothetical protein LTR85_001983 [Meristemomyces frigidus]